MIRFVYPNVIPRESKFLGCGRYVAAPLGEAPDEDYKLVELNIPNITEVHLAALQLAPESADSKKVIYERRDVSSQTYRGESRDLAYVLALISRSRPIRLYENRTLGDIWCTGCLDIKGENRPFLKAVDVNGFSCKLEAFLSEENPDRLFLVPAQNVLPTHELLFQTKNINIVSLTQFQQLSTQDISTRKTIIKIQGDELECLVEMLFKPPTLMRDAQPVISMNPYRGLFAFRERDAEHFFGRESYTRQLVEAVQNKPLVAVIGSSGSGKSSVVYAGLIPQLRRQISSREGQNAISLERGVGSRYSSPGRGHGWVIASFRPGANPFRALSSVIIPLLEPEKSEVEQLVEMKKMTENLKSGHLNLTDIVETIVDKNPDSHLLLIADQFEELYTLCRKEDERRRFLDELLEVPGTSGSAGHLVLTMRADFLGKAFWYRPVADALQNASLILGPMNREELRAVIEKPAETCGVEIEDGLTGRILDTVSGEPGSLPLLEFALAQLWEKQSERTLTHTGYDSIGGVEQAVAYYAERVYENLNSVEKERMQQIFTQLVRPGEGTEDTRRIATRSDVGEENWELVTKLADARLVVTGSASVSLAEQTQMGTFAVHQEETVEVVHEALIQGWQRLRDWIDTNREFRMWQERLRAAIHQWTTSNRDEGALLRGSMLTEAENWVQKRRNELSHREQDFIKTSVQQRDQELQARKNLQRRFTIGLAAGLILAIAFGLFAAYQWNESEKQRQRVEEQTRIAYLRQLEAEKQRRRAEEQTELAKKSLQQAEINAIKALNQSSHALFLSKKDDLGALLAGVKAGKNSRQTLVSTKLKYQILFNLREVVYGIHEKSRLEGHDAQVKCVAFSPDGKMLVSGSNDHTIKFWNVADGRELSTLYGHLGSVKSVAFIPDGRLVASGSSDTTIKLWDVATGHKIRTLYGHLGEVRSIAFSPDGTLIASGSQDKTIKLWNTPNSRKIRTLGSFTGITFPKFIEDSFSLLRFWEGRTSATSLNGHSDTIWSVTFSPDGRLLASGSEDKTIKLWNVADGREIMTLHGHSEPVKSVAFSPDGSLLASGSEDTTIKLWNVADGQELMTLYGHSDTVRSVNFSSDGTLLASGSDEFDGTVKLWNVSDGREISTFKGHYNSVVSVNFNPDSMLLASGSDDHTIKLWNTTDSSKIMTLYQHSSYVTSVDFSPDGTTLASGGYDNTIKLWDVEHNCELITLHGHSKAVRTMSFSPDGTLIASGNDDSTITLWNAADGRELMTLHGHSSVIRSVSFSSDGKLLASGSNDHTIKIWNVADGNEIHTLEGHTDIVRSVSFSPDGRLLVSGSEDKTIKLWNVADGQELMTLHRHIDAVRSVSFSPDGILLASGSGDNTVKLWNVADGREIYTLKGHFRTLLSVDFSPDGTLLASGSQDHTIKLWNVTDGSELATLYGHTNAVNSVKFSPNGRLLASGSRDYRIKLWNLNLDDLLVRGCEKLHGYLKNNPNVSEEDRSLCDDIYPD